METIQDITAEMREFADIDACTIGRDVLRRRIQHFARRIENAATNCNQLKMREALEEFCAIRFGQLKFPLDGDSSTIYDSDKKEIPAYWYIAEILNNVKRAQDKAKSILDGQN